MPRSVEGARTLLSLINSRVTLNGTAALGDREREKVRSHGDGGRAPWRAPLGGSPWLGDVDSLPGDSFAAELVHADAEHPWPTVVAHRELADPDISRAGDPPD